MKTYISILVNIRGCQSWTIYYLSSIFFEYDGLAENFRLSQSKQPNFDYPQMHNNQKIIFVTSKRIDPLNSEQLSCSQKAVNAATEGHNYEAQLWGVL